MKIVAEGIGVDAGMIMVADLSYLEDVPKRDEPDVLGEVFDVPKGIYTVKWRIPETWNGRISGEAEIRVKSGKIFVCDPCYVIGDGKDDDDPEDLWQKWLDDTDYGNDIHSDKAFIIDEMGGDGEYEVHLTLRKIS